MEQLIANFRNNNYQVTSAGYVINIDGPGYNRCSSGVIKVISDQEVEIAIQSGGCHIMAKTDMEKVFGLIHNAPFDEMKAALHINGIEYISGFELHKTDQEYRVRNTQTSIMDSFATLNDAAGFIARGMDGGDLMKTQTVKRLTTSVYGYTAKDSWFVSNDAPQYRYTVESGADCVILAVDLAGVIVRTKFMRATITQMSQHSTLAAMRKAINSAMDWIKDRKWIRDHMREISNYADICAALDEIGYKREDGYYSAEDIFSSSIPGSAIIRIQIGNNEYSLEISIGDSDEYKKFPFGTAPEDIIAWVYEHQPIYKFVLNLQGKLAARDKYAESIHAELEATKTELAATRARLEQIREAVE